MILIQIVDFANGAPCPHAGEFVETFDFEAYNGRGYLTSTPDKTKAMKFASAWEALEFWRTTSKTNPIRWDGNPNRPLTAATVTFVKDDAS